MTVVPLQIVEQCGHHDPCPPAPDAVPVTAWRSQRTLEITLPAVLTEAALERLVRDVCLQARITDLTLIEFRGDATDPGVLHVTGNGHVVTLPIGFVPADILGPWLLRHRTQGQIWTAVHRPEPRDAEGRILAPVV